MKACLSFFSCNFHGHTANWSSNGSIKIWEDSIFPECDESYWPIALKKNAYNHIFPYYFVKSENFLKLHMNPHVDSSTQLNISSD